MHWGEIVAFWPNGYLDFLPQIIDLLNIVNLISDLVYYRGDLKLTKGLNRLTQTKDKHNFEYGDHLKIIKQLLVYHLKWYK